MDPFTIMAGASAAGGLIGGLGSWAAADAQKKGIKRGLREFDAATAGAEGTVNAGADAALGHIQPYAQGGQNALKLYLDAVGANGAGAQQGYYDGFMDDPGFQQALDQGLKSVEHSRLYRGSSLSGSAQKELYAFGENARLGAHKDRLSQLSSLSQIGLQAGTTGANIETNRGTTLADIALKKGSAHLNARMGQGVATASGIVGATNAATGALENISSLYKKPSGLGGGDSGGLYSFTPASAVGEKLPWATATR